MFKTTDQKPKADMIGVCPDCGGTGRIRDRHSSGKRQRTKKCMLCRGTGKASGNYQTK